MTTIDPHYANQCFNITAKPANEHGDQPVINHEQFATILAAILAHGKAADALIGDVSNWKPTGFLNADQGRTIVNSKPLGVQDIVPTIKQYWHGVEPQDGTP